MLDFSAGFSYVKGRRVLALLLATILPVWIFLATSCTRCSDSEEQVPEPEMKAVQPVQVKIHRYEKALFSLNSDSLAKGLKSLQPEFAFFIGPHPEQQNNVVQMRAYLQDTLIRQLYHQTMQVYPSLDSIEKELGSAFGAYRELIPGAPLPQVYTYVSGADYEAPIRFVDSVMIIALDMYLGKDYHVYSELGIPEYRQYGFEPTFLVPDCIKQMIIHQIPGQNKNQTLLDWMVVYGKILCFLDLALPERPDYQKITYSPEQMTWCRDHEKEIWAQFIRNNALYTTDSKEIVKFIGDGPDTKGFPEEAPGRIGWFVGWQIVRHYMATHEELSFEKLLKISDSQKLLTESGYRPGK